MTTRFLVTWALALCFIIGITDAGQVSISPEALNNKMTATIGEQFVMTCTSSGNDDDKPKALQWRSARGSLFADDKFGRVYTQLIGDSLRLWFSPVSAEDSTVYFCSFMQDGQQREMSVELVLRKKISFLDTPIQQSIRASNVDQLVVCKTESIPGPEISWMRNDLSLRNDAKYQITNDGLTIKNVQAEDEGTYTCQAMVLSTGEARKLDISVQVITKPQWVQEPQDVEGTRGQELILKCDAFAKPAPLIKFFRGDILLAGNRYIQQGNLMTIRQLDSSDSGTYTCLAENEAGPITANFRIIALIGPVLKPIETLTVSENEKATLRCDVLEAFPPPTFRWKYTQTQTFIESIPEKITVTNKELSSELRFENVKSSDRGNYTCVATNKAAVTETSAIINVKYSPIFRINELARDRYYSWLRKDDMGVSIGSAVIMTCIVDAYPPASIKWLFKAQTLVDGPKYRFLPLTQEGISQIEINPKDVTDFGAYTCQADNSVNKNSRDIPLLEATVPRSAPILDKSIIQSTLVGFKVTAPSGGESDGGLPIESFQVQWKLAGLDWSKPALKEVALPLSAAQETVDINVDNLVPDSEYVFRVAAVNRPGVGAWSPDVTIRTLPRRQPDPVIILNNEVCGNPVKCMIEWVPKGDGGSPIINYVIMWQKMTFKDPEARIFDKYEGAKLSHSVEGGITKFELSALHPGSYYHVTVSATNVLGPSALNEIKVKTLNSGVGEYSIDSAKLGPADRILGANRTSRVAASHMLFFIASILSAFMI